MMKNEASQITGFTKYKSIFENITINIEKNKVVVKVLLAKESIEKSSIIQVVQSK